MSKAPILSPRVDSQYTTLAVGDLHGLPPRFSDQIIRKIERLRTGLIGDVKALTNAEAGYRLRSGIIVFCSTATGKPLSFAESLTAAMPTVKAVPAPHLTLQRRRVARKIAILREEVDDLRDSLDLLDARARDDGRRRSTDEVRAKLGLDLPKR